MKYIIGCMAMLLPLLCGAQAAPIKALNIGDNVPDITITNVYNYPSSTIRLSDLKGKLVIFDFISTGCVPCIEELPGLDSLQKKYSNKLQIMLVISESVSRVHSFLKRKNIAGINLAVIAEDTTLSQLFPHTFIPHDIWIKNGKVLFITQPEYVIAKNIQPVLENKEIDLPIKRDLPSFDYSQPLLHWNDYIIPSFSVPQSGYYSTLTSHMPDVPERFTIQKDSGKSQLRISMINVPVIDLYMRTLYGVGLKPSFIILKVADTNKYRYNKNEGYYQQWLLKNTYCYEGLFPLNTKKEDIKNRIKNDLDFYLQLDGKMIKKNVSCWVISKISDSSPVKKNSAVKNLVPSENASIDDILFFLNKDFGDTPAIDETGYGEVKLEGLRWSECTDIAVLKKKLKESGFQIKLTTRIIDMLQIEENNQHDF